MSNSALDLTIDEIDEASTNFTISAFQEHVIMECTILGFSFMYGLPTNAYVIWLIITGAGSGAASELFMLNLTVCGLLYSVNNLLALLNVFHWLKSIVNFLFGVSITGVPLFQCLICVERYLAVVHPVTFLKYRPLRYRVICCTVAWIITTGSCLTCMQSSRVFTQYTYMCFLSMQFLFFLFIQLFCCFAVLRALKQSGPGERSGERVEENHLKRKAFYLILMTTASTVISYVPVTITALIFIVTEHLISILWTVSWFCFILGGCLPPALYLHRTGKLSCLIIPFSKCVA